jgi:hypothetical protein
MLGGRGRRVHQVPGDVEVMPTNSQRQERTTAKRYHGVTNSGSGNGWVRKNDVRTDTESFECKTTTKGSFTLKLSDLTKAEQHALLDGRRMVFEIEFSSNDRRYVILSEEDYYEMHINEEYMEHGIDIPDEGQRDTFGIQ